MGVLHCDDCTVCHILEIERIENDVISMFRAFPMRSKPNNITKTKIFSSSETNNEKEASKGEQQNC